MKITKICKITIEAKTEEEIERKFKYLKKTCDFHNMKIKEIKPRVGGGFRGRVI